MTFSILDLILILVIFGFVIYGFAMGLIEALGALAGLALGVFLAGKFYPELGETLRPALFGRKTLSDIVAFIIVFTIISRLIGFVFYLANKIFHFFTIIPFLKSINRFSGAILGLIEGILVTGIALLFISQFPLTSWLAQYLKSSQVALFLMYVAKIFTPLLGAVFQEVKQKYAL